MRARTILALLLAVGLAVWLMTRRAETEPDAPAVVAQIQRLNQLATVRYTVQKVVDLEEPKYPIGAERILLILQAHVVAGVDLAALRAEDVVVERNGNVIVRMPRARILNVAVDDRETRVWDRRKTWWTPWVPFSKDLEQKARVQGLDAARQAALEMGILDQAQRNAEDSVRSLLTLSGVKTVQILPNDHS